MKHRRGINLSAPFTPHRSREAAFERHKRLSDLTEYEVLGAMCSACERVAWLDKRAVERLYGNGNLSGLEGKLVCECGNRTGNRALIGVLPR